MRRFAILVVAAVLSTAGVASAQRGRASANQPARAARVKAPAKPAVIPTNALLTLYQRVGRELMLVANDRNAKIGIEGADAKLSCAELQATFRSIKISDAIATPQSRAATAELLHELQLKIERLRGVAVSQECLNNPLAKDCT